MSKFLVEINVMKDVNLRGSWVELLARYPHLKESLKNLQTINAGGGVEKREPSSTVGRNVN